MTVRADDARFTGSISELYESELVPLLFAPYAEDVVDRLSANGLTRVLEVAAGTGVVTRALASALPASVTIVATDLNQTMLDTAAAAGTSRPVEWRRADAMDLPFEDDSFDYVVLSQTLQAMKNSEIIMREMLRVGREGIVTFPNFGYWRNRLHIAAGYMPVSENLPYQWFDTPNVQLCTIADFERFCRERRIRIVERKVLTKGATVKLLPNLLGALAIFHFGNGAE